MGKKQKGVERGGLDGASTPLAKQVIQRPNLRTALDEFMQTAQKELPQIPSEIASKYALPTDAVSQLRGLERTHQPELAGRLDSANRYVALLRIDEIERIPYTIKYLLKTGT